MLLSPVLRLFKPDNVLAGKPPYTEAYLAKVLQLWLSSEDYHERLLGQKYYEGKQDILFRQRKALGKNGMMVPLKNVPNEKLVDNQYRKLIDQKTNYILGKPMTLAAQNDEYYQELSKIFNRKMYRKLRVLARYAIEGGIAWVYPYYNKEGNFDIAVFPATAVCPIWEDRLHTELKGAVRYYEEAVISDNGTVEKLQKAELYTDDGVFHYLWQDNGMVYQRRRDDYIETDETGFNWGRIPLIPFKYNDSETPLIRGTKSLQDAMNLAMSDFLNNMEEDARNTILVVKNYDGTETDGVRESIANRGVVKVTTIDGVQGGVDPLRITIDADVFQAFLMQTKRALIENGRGFDAKEERMDGDPNQMNIESMYTDIDLDVNALETEFQAGFENLKWFIDRYLVSKGLPDYSEEELTFIFNRDIFINEDAKIDSCVKSASILSRATVVANHPWTTNVQNELEEIQREEEEELERMAADDLRKEALKAEQAAQKEVE